MGFRNALDKNNKEFDTGAFGAELKKFRQTLLKEKEDEFKHLERTLNP